MSLDDTQLQQPLHQPTYERRAQMPCATHAKAIADQGQRVALTEKSVSAMERTMEAVSTKLDLILAQITRVAILEEKHSTQQADVNRAHAKIDALAKEVEGLAKETRAFISYSQGRDKVLWALGAVVLGLFIKALFFASSHGMTP